VISSQESLVLLFLHLILEVNPFSHFFYLSLEIADKTAEYVAKNGSAFEEIVMKSESNNPKFSFLKPNDPYRAYYDQKVVEFAKGISM